MKNSCGFIIESEGQYLMCHPTGRPFKNGVWDIPKGKKEKNESKLKAALRETKEETGLQLSLSKGGHFFIGDFNYSNRKKKLSVFYFKSKECLINKKLVCETKVEGKDFFEHDDFKWVSFQEAINLSHKTLKKAFKELENINEIQNI